MSKAKFAAAKELIDEKKYDQARAILMTIDHPTAAKWLEKLDQISPVTKSSPIAANIKPSNVTSHKSNRFLIIGLVSTIVILLLLYRVLNPPRSLVSTIATQSTSVSASNANVSSNEIGSKNNPVPLGSGYAFPGYGTLTVIENQWQAGQTGFAIVKLNLICELPSDQVCKTSDFTFSGDVIGASGTIYKQSFDSSNIPSPQFMRPGESEVYGGGTKSGYAGFSLTAQENGLLMRVNLGTNQDKVFFDLSTPLAANIVSVPSVTQSQKNSDTALGTRNNPYPLGQSVSFPGFGTLSIKSQWQAGQTGIAVIQLRLTCDRPSNQKCNSSNLRLDAIGDSGTVYDDTVDSNVPLPNFSYGTDTEVYGGGVVEGYTGFNITQQEKHVVLRVQIFLQDVEVFLSM